MTRRLWRSGGRRRQLCGCKGQCYYKMEPWRDQGRSSGKPRRVGMERRELTGVSSHRRQRRRKEISTAKPSWRDERDAAISHRSSRSHLLVFSSSGVKHHAVAITASFIIPDFCIYNIVRIRLAIQSGLSFSHLEIREFVTSNKHLVN